MVTFIEPEETEDEKESWLHTRINELLIYAHEMKLARRPLMARAVNLDIAYAPKVKLIFEMWPEYYSDLDGEWPSELQPNYPVKIPGYRGSF